MQISTNTVQGVSSAFSENSLGSVDRNISPNGAAAPFSSLLRDAVGQIHVLEDQAHQAVEGLMNGSGVDVHQAMIATQKADMAFEMALSVRNKAVQAYQQIMSMQF